MANLVAIVGRPNVGKSTLFNRLTNSRRAIVSETAGTTRDRQYGKCLWNGREFSLVDTGGWVVKSDDIFEDAIRKQVRVATDEADLVLFVVDNETGITDWDEDVAQILRRASVPILLVANKIDNSGRSYEAAEFYKLGLGDPICVSAITGGGTGDLLDIILEKLEDVPEEEVDDNLPRFAVVGRPNVGKSSIINAFIGEDRNIVTEIAGTTRDSIYTRYNKFGFDFYLVDTAGIRRKNKVSEDLEFYSVMRSIRAIENSDVCILMIDATRGIEGQDMNIFQIIQRNKKSLVVVVNKWDLVEEKTQKHIDTFTNAIRLPHHLHLGPDQAAHLQGARTGQGCLRQPQDPHRHQQAQRGDAAHHREHAAPLDQGQVYQDQVLLAAAQHADPLVCLLRQPAAIHQGALPSLPGEQDARALVAHRHPDQHLHPPEMMHAFSLRPFLGSLLGTGALALSLLLGSCSDKPQETVNQGELAARTAKIYYDSLAAGRFDSFYEGKLKADTVPETYRQQMKAILRQFADNEQKRHKGIDSVRISNYQYAEKTQTANVFLTLVYGDKTQEQVVVPMVRRDSLWYMR